MVNKAMGFRWNTCGNKLSTFAILILVLGVQGCWSINSEGLALLEFRGRVAYDPYGAFDNWNPEDNDPCMWLGVHCVDGKLQILDLNGLSLEGELVPELGKLTHLRSLVISNNRFSGAIPKDIGGLIMLEVLDLRNNNFSGTIPPELGGLQSLKRLLLCNNSFKGDVPLELGRLNLLFELQFDENLTFAVTTGISCVNRKFGHCIWQSSLKKQKKADLFLVPVKETLLRNLNALPLFKSGKDSLNSPEYENLPASGGSPPVEIVALPTSRSSGSYPAVQKGKEGQLHQSTPSTGDSVTQPNPKTANPDSQSSGSVNKPAEEKPSSGGISGYAWKHIGVPKLNRAELESACEDFSNIIDTIDGCTIYKGTLSSGVEIAVASTAIYSAKDWSKRSEVVYRKKINTLSRVNHKNFVNLIGFCEEEEPFTRMMVFEYAPNGTAFEHLHVKEVEHLDWNARMRIIMGTAYCLQYMHELNPPVAHSNLTTTSIFLTDDYAAKIAEISFGTGASSKSKISGENDSEHSELPPFSDPETNVYSFGIMLLEIISGKLPNKEEQGPLVNWAAQYLSDKRNISYMIDPTLKSFKNNELDIICEVIQDCIQQDARKRPTMKEITSRLREVIAITPDAATPRLSPLWWAELEILSAEST
ncbi:hypothetical protein RHGRI_037717 [Rhododendron griersonianum]|uniref:Protein kinase domain-containing protein n=1 Tax=Rhododendron griersonianum TaxID=479676 RepID=A0AAV6HY94_9ERIC|nr:hypothetical protein RHGRI_037717 [Rhododendron griersonianum]